MRNPDYPSNRRSFFLLWSAVLAAVLLATGVFLYNRYQERKQSDLALKKELQQYKVYRSPFGQRMTISLADHSTVTLNANSILKVPHGYHKGSRKVLLSGAAYFDIRKDAALPFIVESSDMKVTVLGTSFYLRAYPHESGQQVELLSGKLKVQKAYVSDIDNQAEILLPGDMVMLNKSVDLMEKETFDTQIRQSWIKGQLRFDHASFNEVVAVLEDWYGVPIEVQGQQNYRGKFSGTYENESLEKVLGRFSLATGCNFAIDEGKIILRSN